MSLREALLIGLGAGLLFGVLAAFLLEFLDDSIRTRQDLLNVAGGALPVLGVIPVSRSSRAEVVSLADPYTPAAEAYRSLRTAVHFAASDRKQCVAITTARSRQGKTETVVNLAVPRPRPASGSWWSTATCGRRGCTTSSGCRTTPGSRPWCTGHRCRRRSSACRAATTSTCSPPDRSRGTRRRCWPRSGATRCWPACRPTTRWCSSTRRRCCSRPTPPSWPRRSAGCCSWRAADQPPEAAAAGAGGAPSGRRPVLGSVLYRADSAETGGFGEEASRRDRRQARRRRPDPASVRRPGAARPTGRHRTAAGDLRGRDRLTAVERVPAPGDGPYTLPVSRAEPVRSKGRRGSTIRGGPDMRSVHVGRCSPRAAKRPDRSSRAWGCPVSRHGVRDRPRGRPAGAHTPHDDIADVAVSPHSRTTTPPMRSRGHCC